MIIKTAYRGKYVGKKFWGCPTWKQTKCNTTYPVTAEQETEFKKLSNPYTDLNIFQKIKRWWNESHYISGTSYNGAVQRFDWTRKTTNGTQLIITIVFLTVIGSYFISKDNGNAVFGILLCLPLFIFIIGMIKNGIKRLFGK